ncbi:MAG: peptide ABC transporter substrate-binding protein [Bacteroidales bacterium]|nr:peptide ABC transporter substrate-binding protein [Candidatus Latescibacterota bacterium]
MSVPRLFVYLSVVIIAVMSGCGNSEDSGVRMDGDSAVEGSLPVNQGGRLVIGMQQEPEILNEAVNSMVVGIYVCNMIFSKFVKHDDNMKLIPDLITEIPTVENGGISKDHLTYTYHLRDDAFWHDGLPVTSGDVEFSWRLMMHPDINVETRQGWDIVESVETPDPQTVIFHLGEVYANFTGDCFYDESVMPKHLLEGDLGPDFQALPFHRHPTGSGPFIFHEWVSGSHLTVKANKDYYGEGPYLDEIVIVFIPDGNSLLLQLETGSVMGIDNAPNMLLDFMDGLEGIRVFRNVALFNEHLDLNFESPILGDKDVRKALARAIDREEISQKIYDGVWLPAWGDEHPSSPYYTDTGKESLSLDRDLSRSILRGAGWIDRDGDGIREKNGKPLRVEISTTTGRLNRERTELVLQKQLREVGFDLVIKNYHPTVMFGSYDEGGILKRGKFDLGLYAFLAPPDPSTKDGSYSEDFIPPAGQNYSRIRNRRLTELLDRGGRTVSFEERKMIYDEVADIVLDELPIIPLLWVTQLDAMPLALKGYRANPTQSGDTWNVSEWWLQGE